MSSSLLAGVSGLRAHQTLLDVVGNNLANLNTPGYKSSRARFSDLLSDTKKAATGAVEGRIGGTNPLQIGLGVKVASIDINLSQGNLEATGGDLDLAIQGNGHFVVSDGVQDLYTRTGAFAIDEQNFLVDPSTGYRVQRFGIVGEGDDVNIPFQEPDSGNIFIPFGEGIAGQATTDVVLQGNLSASAVGPRQETIISSTAFTEGGVAATTASLLNDLDSNTVDYTAGDIISIAGTDAADNVINLNLAVDGTTTLGDIVSQIDAAFTGVTATLDAAGNIQAQADNTGPAQLTLTVTDDDANTGFTSFSNHIFDLTVEGKDGDIVSTAIEVFDKQGSPKQLSIVFQKEDDNLWNMTASIDADDGTTIDGEVNSIRFNDNGSFQQVTGTGVGDGNIEFQFNGINSPQVIGLSFGENKGFDGVTQVGGNSSAAATSQDGFSAGFLADLSISPDGIIEGVFTNGRTLPVAQLGIAAFSNPGGLQRVGDNYFAVTNNSGIPLLGGGLSGGRGSIQGGTLESSNVDVAQEFTQLIVAQRGFQVNSRTITVTDEILEELANIVR